MQLHFKEKKKRKPLGDLGGRVGNLKLTPKVFFFFKLFFFFFLEGGEMPRKDLGAHFSPQPAAFAGFLGKVNCPFPQNCGGDCGRLGMGVSGTRECLLEEACKELYSQIWRKGLAVGALSGPPVSS